MLERLHAKTCSTQSHLLGSSTKDLRVKEDGAGKMGQPVWWFEGATPLPHIRWHLNKRSLADGPVWAGLGGVALLMEGCQ